MTEPLRSSTARQISQARNKNRYTGPVQTISFDEGMGITEEEPAGGDEPPTATPPATPA